MALRGSREEPAFRRRSRPIRPPLPRQIEEQRIQRPRRLYDISVAKTGTERTLSIVEVPLTLIEDDSPVTYAQFFSCLGNGVLRATGCGTKSTSCRVEKEDEDVYIRLYRPVNVEEGEEETQRGGIVLSSKCSVYYFKLL